MPVSFGMYHCTMDFAIAVHGGAGVLPQGEMTEDLRLQYEAGLHAAVKAGYDALAQGADALTAVTRAVTVLEDDPIFNAGRGAVFNHIGTHELDASIMDGRSLQAGAVCGVSHIKNPVLLARLIMEKSEHVMLCGNGAEQFAVDQGMALVDASYFDTERRRQQWLRASRQQAMQLDDGKILPIGTVGAVARDAAGNLAAATSTGGITNKRYGRVGDSPIIGAGTYACNQTCAVSCTGHGEFFLRHVVAYDVHCLMAYRGLTLEAAVRYVLFDKLLPAGGEGGIIAVDAEGQPVLLFNGAGMYRGYQQYNAAPVVEIY